MEVAMIVIYIAGPYRARTPWLVEQNLRAAEALALEVWRAGLTPLCPHTMTRFMDGEIPDEAALAGTLELMRRCDAVLLVPGWERSAGTQAEVAEARRLGLPVFESLGALLAERTLAALRGARVLAGLQREAPPVAGYFESKLDRAMRILGWRDEPPEEWAQARTVVSTARLIEYLNALEHQLTLRNIDDARVMLVKMRGVLA